METMVVPYAIRSYTVVIHEAEEGGYWGEVLELPGCVSQGETLDELRHNLREALEAILECESQGPRIELYTEPIVAEKESLEFEIPESGEGEVCWVKVSDTWTATG